MEIKLNEQIITLNIEEDTFVPSDPEGLAKEACRIPGKIAYYGALLSELKASVERAKFTMDEVSAFVGSSLRKEAQERITIDRMKELVTLDDRVKEAKNKWINEYRTMSLVDNTLRALYKKADIITTLLYQHRQEMKVYGQL